MIDQDLATYTIGELVPLLRTREVSPVHVVQACLDRVERLNGTLCAYTTVLAEPALHQAREAERALAKGESRSLLHGIPVSVKDVCATRGIRTTWGARFLATYCPPGDSTVVVKLREAGAILLGKTNVDTYPYDGSPGSPRLIGPTRNPWDLARTAGRSSGGSAASVAASLDFGSIGSDNGGSIRIPAALCGVVGLKPTFGRVSKYRVFPYSDSFDHCGPLARSVYDCAALLGAIAGHDPKDATTVDRPVHDYVGGLEQPVRGLRAGVARVAWEGNDPEVTRLVGEAIEVVSSLGLTMRDTDLPGLDHALWADAVGAAEINAMAEELAPRPTPANPYAAYMLERSQAFRQRVFDEGMGIVQAVRQAYAEIFRHIDLLVLPTVPITAPLLTEETSPWTRADEVFVEMPARYTRLFNLIGYPAISVPCGYASDGMPVGVQIAGRPFEEEILLRVAHRYEQATDWHLRHPSPPLK